jgi:hypothetical protein
VYVFSFAVHFDQLCFEVGTNLLKHDFEPLDGVPVKDLSSILCNEDQEQQRDKMGVTPWFRPFS